MKGGRQFFVGMLIAALTGVLTLGSISLSLLESGYVLVSGPGEPGLEISFSGERVLVLARDATATAARLAQAVGQEAAATFSPAAPVCSPPPGWNLVQAAPDQTLRSLAHLYGTTVDDLKQANCIVGSSLAPGSELYVPARAAVELRFTATPAVCRPPYGWTVYNVRPGDTYGGIAARVGQSVGSLLSANCTSSAYLYVGQALYVPYQPPVVYPTATVGPWFTSTAPWLPTNTATQGVIPTATHTPPTPATATAEGETPSPTVSLPPPTDTAPPPPPPTDTPPPPTDTPAPPPTATPPPPPSDTPAPPPTIAPPPPAPTNTPGSFPYP